MRNWVTSKNKTEDNRTKKKPATVAVVAVTVVAAGALVPVVMGAIAFSTIGGLDIVLITAVFLLDDVSEIIKTAHKITALIEGNIEEKSVVAAGEEIAV